MNYPDLITSLNQTFINQDDYFFDKHVPEFTKEGKFLGDYFNQLAVESLDMEVAASAAAMEVQKREEENRD